ncbi:hypothetical protein FEM48_Zijuj08G0034000 [Ziziphus jujuba var. spinosa]|uniref:Protein LHY n=1 Tax=Ziziphus jujuba var. spinosa TaxID=714518 RepID=A0A978UWQ2_ZIZJJ|nr:hypothetical protein FEM48_Zijuj08G0034000 [Ziziphus jujuba var. spinosa]
MDTYSSGEDLVIKTRKPYTITKQRERWTEEEHNRFLEALKLYGRAWQRIEEHIGTKTAVQIRSHAQKFFSKLEKEALVKGVPIGQTLDIDIPPPRPKRKPSNPYPRKTSAAIPTSHVGVKDVKLLPSESSSHCKQVLDLEKEPIPERPGGEEDPTNEKENPTNEKENQDENCSEVFTMLQEAHYSSISSANRNSMPSPVALTNACTFREFVPSSKQANQDESNGSYVTIEHQGNQNLEKVNAKQRAVQDNATNRRSKFDNSNSPLEELVQNEKRNDLNCEMPTEELQTTQNYPRHVPVHVLDGSLGNCTQTPSADISFQDPIFHPIGEVPGHPTVFPNPAASATTEHQSNVSRSSVHQSFPPFHPTFTPIRHDQDEYRSFLQMSSTFSSLIVSTLLQNPAAHAAASFAATFWPYANMETSADSPACPHGGFPSRQMNSTPSMAAITAATVAAATAWWAAHGLLPLCAPLHTGFACAPASTSVPSMDTGQALAAKTERGENSPNPPLQDQLDVEHSEALQSQHSASKSPTQSSTESEESGAAKPDTCLKAADDEKATAEPDLHDSNPVKSRKQVDRSSCGSNTASSSEVETDALEKHDKGKEELKESDKNHPATESTNRRIRSTSTLIDSWKEVSEELIPSFSCYNFFFFSFFFFFQGRLAFQALFSREVLPQSFSPPRDILNKKENQNNSAEGDKQNVEEKGGDTLLLDLNRRILLSRSIQQEVEKNASSRSDTNGDEGLLTIGLGHGKLKTRRTGFKPYKRCSVEAKENRVGSAGCQGEEKGPKRLRLEGEAST